MGPNPGSSLSLKKMDSSGYDYGFDEEEEEELMESDDEEEESDVESDEEEEQTESDEDDSEKLEVLPTTLLDDKWDGPVPLFFQRRPTRSMDIFVNIHKAFAKRRPFRSRFAIQLYFDNEELEKTSNIMSENNLISGYYDGTYITLTSSPFAHQSKLENILKTLALKQENIQLLSASSILPRGKSLSFSLSPSNPLILFHSKLCQTMEKERIEIGENYMPSTWRPFCVVAKEVPGNQMGDAIKALQDIEFPISGYAEQIELVEYKYEPELFMEEEATLLFRKEITSVDAMLCRFKVPKEKAENEMYFPRLDYLGSVSMQVWDPESKLREMVLRRYMKYTYHITANWKLPEKRMKLVAGDVILFYKKRERVLEFPYEYMIRFEGRTREDGYEKTVSGTSVDIQDNSESSK